MRPCTSLPKIVDDVRALERASGLQTCLALETAVKQCQAWLADDWHLSVAVNLSGYDIQDAALPELIASLLAR